VRNALKPVVSTLQFMRLNELMLALALEYLGLEELVAFDSAVTNRESRGYYLTALTRVDATKALAMPTHGNRFKWQAAFKWVVQRGLRLPVVLEFPSTTKDSNPQIVRQPHLNIEGAVVGVSRAHTHPAAQTDASQHRGLL
jgi:hypothetical protein